jgi:hypothetical protein
MREKLLKVENELINKINSKNIIEKRVYKQ